MGEGVQIHLPTPDESWTEFAERMSERIAALEAERHRLRAAAERLRTAARNMDDIGAGNATATCRAYDAAVKQVIAALEEGGEG